MCAAGQASSQKLPAQNALLRPPLDPYQPSGRHARPELHEAAAGRLRSGSGLRREDQRRSTTCDGLRNIKPARRPTAPRATRQARPPLDQRRCVTLFRCGPRPSPNGEPTTKEERNRHGAADFRVPACRPSHARVALSAPPLQNTVRGSSCGSNDDGDDDGTRVNPSDD